MSVSDITSLLALLFALGSGAVSAAMYHFKIREKIVVMNTHLNEVRGWKKEMDAEKHGEKFAVINTKLDRVVVDISELKDLVVTRMPHA